MLAGLQDYIDEQPQGDILIVLHQMGNHGPAYSKRYPPAFERFTPTCTTNQLNECTNEEIGNAYDNAILYTDAFLARVITLLKNNSQKFETAMAYFSDHGESLGEYGLYLHGLPYAMAPRTARSTLPRSSGLATVSRLTKRRSATKPRNAFPMTTSSTPFSACLK